MKPVEIAQIREQDILIRPRQIALHNGRQITIASARAADVGKIDEMHERLSKETLYFRYLSPNKPPRGEFEHLCRMGGENGLALIAIDEEDEEKVVGIACFCLDKGNQGSAEPAILVEDAYQGCGLGRELMQALCQSAYEMGVTQFQCWTHPSNQRVHQMIQRCWVHLESRYREGMRVFQVQMQPTAPASQAA